MTKISKHGQYDNEKIRDILNITKKVLLKSCDNK